MKSSFYPKLAWDGIRKNKQLYVPYIIACVGSVMMYYILSFLSVSPALEAMEGSITICTMLKMGSGVIAIFSLLFLFYSNSFLMRRRKREFGLYNILGMGKWNISKILFWEVLIVAGISLLGGTGFGIALSKLFELALINMMHGAVSFTLTLSVDSIISAVAIFCGIFLLIFLNALRQISLSKPIELIRSENTGEKPPKANWFVGILGLVILAAAYYFAVNIENPVMALSIFFIAVIMVVCGTYLLLISGSVVLCRILQKNKKYYYKSNHFVSVSSMAYRMKRNGAGLASICILLTMVLVMISSTAALFIGVEDSIRIRYPKDLNISMSFNKLEDAKQERTGALKNINKVLNKYGVTPLNVYDYSTFITSGYLKDDVLYNDPNNLVEFNSNEESEIVVAYFVSLSDYNRMMDENKELKDGEVMVCPFRTEYTSDTFKVNGGETYKVKEVVDKFVDNGDSAMTIFPTIFVFVPDLEATETYLNSLCSNEKYTAGSCSWYYAFDLDLPKEKQMEVYRELRDIDIASSEHIDIECLNVERKYFYELFGGLFFLGILLSIVFIAAAVLIIYYKQIAEGYEDQDRFKIMQKVGMTRNDIRKTINSQMLTVFFVPLVLAGIHLCFAFPVIRKLLMIFNLWDIGLLIMTTVVCFLICGLFYIITYKLTSNRYIALVNGGKK